MRSPAIILAAILAAPVFFTSGPGTAQQPTTPDAPIRIKGPEHTGQHLRLIALGDAGLPESHPESHLTATLEGLRRIAPADGILLLGDNIYECGVEGVQDPKWRTILGPLLDLGLPIYPVLGNHDWGKRAQRFNRECRRTTTDPEAQLRKTGTPGFERWHFPAYTYVVETPLAEIILFDSTPIAKQWPEREQRLAALRAALARPKTRPWRIVAAHHAVHTCGAHATDKDTTRFRKAVEGLLKSSAVDVYIAGHDHDLEIRSDPAPRPLYLISGAAAKLRSSSACRRPTDFKIQGGFAVLDVTAERLVARFYCNDQDAPCMETDLLLDTPGSHAPQPLHVGGLEGINQATAQPVRQGQQ